MFPTVKKLFVITLFVGGICLLSPTDNTDVSYWERSGMRLYTDNLTGCQYLGGLFGAPTPRLDATGEHVCIKAGER